jgi:hypothetical protein
MKNNQLVIKMVNLDNSSLYVAGKLRRIYKVGQTYRAPKEFPLHCYSFDQIIRELGCIENRKALLCEAIGSVTIFHKLDICYFEHTIKSMKQLKAWYDDFEKRIVNPIEIFGAIQLKVLKELDSNLFYDFGWIDYNSCRNPIRNFNNHPNKQQLMEPFK